MNLLPNEHVVTLISLNQGAAVEMFQAALDKVLANIKDANVEPTQKREINLKFTFTPDIKGKRVDVSIACDQKLAAHRPTATTVYIGPVEGKLQAVEADPDQGMLFDESATKGKMQ